MTRDEAIKKAQDCFKFDDYGQQWSFTPLRLVAALENLGLFKVDEPPTVRSRLSWVIAARPSCDPINAATVLCWLEEAGLKAVEK